MNVSVWLIKWHIYIILNGTPTSLSALRIPALYFYIPTSWSTIFLPGWVYEERRKTSTCASQSTQHTLRAKKYVAAVLIVWPGAQEHLINQYFSVDVRLGGRADEDSGWKETQTGWGKEAKARRGRRAKSNFIPLAGCLSEPWTDPSTGPASITFLISSYIFCIFLNKTSHPIPSPSRHHPHHVSVNLS